MLTSPWKSEILNLFLGLLLVLFLYEITNNLLISISTSFICYILFLGYRFKIALDWFKGGMDDDSIPESSGIICNIISLVYRHKKLLENNIEQQKNTVRQFTDIISAIPSATVILNKNHEIEWANYPALVLLGISGQHDIGIKIESLLRQSIFSKYLSKGTGEEFEMMSPIDNNITLVVQLAPYTQNKYLLLANNISPHIEIQRSRKTFIANASHELRTPLTVISGYLEFIQSTSNLPESLVVPVNKAIEQSANMQVLIDDLLALSHLENKKLTNNLLTKIDIKKHLTEVLQTLEAAGKFNGYNILSHVDKNVYLNASKKELDSICYNLINNAIKYSEKGSNINISWKNISQDQVIFSVSDNGIGIAPEHISHLTERFYRVDSGRSRREGGTGLGLSITKHIVERHNGIIEINSRLGKGSTFSVILPINPLKDNN